MTNQFIRVIKVIYILFIIVYFLMIIAIFISFWFYEKKTYFTNNYEKKYKDLKCFSCNTKETCRSFELATIRFELDTMYIISKNCLHYEK